MNRRRLMGNNSNNGRFMIGDYQVVDLGLPSGLLWATCNVGAKNETDYGDYYKGEEWVDADIATQAMGSEWRLPKRSEMYELVDNTDYSFVTINGVNGGKFTSKTNPNVYVFFPAAGRYQYLIDNPRYGEGDNGYVWGSTLDFSNRTYSLVFSYNDKSVTGTYRTFLLPARGVTSVGGKLTLFKRILILFKSLVKKGGEVC